MVGYVVSGYLLSLGEFDYHGHVRETSYEVLFYLEHGSSPSLGFCCGFVGGVLLALGLVFVLYCALVPLLGMFTLGVVLTLGRLSFRELLVTFSKKGVLYGVRP